MPGFTHRDLGNAAPRSLALDTRRFDYGPPLLDFGLLKSAESFWSLLVEGRSFDAEIGQASPHRRDVHHFLGSSIEFGDDILRGPSGRPKRIPNRKVELRQSRLVDCWNIRCCC